MTEAKTGWLGRVLIGFVKPWEFTHGFTLACFRFALGRLHTGDWRVARDALARRTQRL